MAEKAMPELKTSSQVTGIHVSMETMKAPSSTYHRVRTMRSIWGARAAAVLGGVGGSMEASGSLASSNVRSPGTKSSARTSTMKGREGRTAE